VRVLIISQYFEPELTAASIRLGSFASGLAAGGHDVEVICEVPNHPRGEIEPEFRGRWVVDRRADGYRVKHVRVHASPSKRAQHRLASYASFAAAAVAAGGVASRPDVILASSPPLSVGAVGRLLGLRHRVPWVFDVRDLWPEIAVALGELRDGPALRFAELLERHLYASAVAVVTPTTPFAERIRSIAGAETRIEVIANGTDERWLDAGQRAPDRTGSGLDRSRFVWTYAGNVGLSQDLETAIEASALLGDDFELLILGDGASRRRLETLAAGRPGRVRFRDPVPPADAMSIMRASDALLVSLADRPELGRSVPIKLYDSCAIGRPVVLAAAGEARRLAARSGAAVIVAPEDPRALAAAVRRLRDEPETVPDLIARGREFASAHTREAGIEALERLLVAVSPRAVP
jgi:glycosyltransferase involved in cell wall biosynthesis